MNDEFLYQFRKQPRRAFAEMLYERINPGKNRTFQKSLVQKMAWAIGMLFLTLAVMLIVSPTARAQVEQIIKQIAGITFYEVEKFPSENFDGVPLPALSQTMSLDEIQNEVPFDINIPTWVPDGFESISVNLVESQVTNKFSNWSIICLWQKNYRGIGTTLNLFMTYIGTQEAGETGPSTHVGPGSVEEVDVNGKPAALIRGGGWSSFDCYLCDPSHSKPTATPQWSNDSSLTLMWIDDGVMYQLLADDAYYVSVEDLIRMAESMR